MAEFKTGVTILNTDPTQGSILAANKDICRPGCAVATAKTSAQPITVPVLFNGAPTSLTHLCPMIITGAELRAETPEALEAILQSTTTRFRFSNATVVINSLNLRAARAFCAAAGPAAIEPVDLASPAVPDLLINAPPNSFPDRTVVLTPFLGGGMYVPGESDMTVSLTSQEGDVAAGTAEFVITQAVAVSADPNPLRPIMTVTSAANTDNIESKFAAAIHVDGIVSDDAEFELVTNSDTIMHRFKREDGSWFPAVGGGVILTPLVAPDYFKTWFQDRASLHFDYFDSVTLEVSRGSCKPRAGPRVVLACLNANQVRTINGISGPTHWITGEGDCF